MRHVGRGRYARGAYAVKQLMRTALLLLALSLTVCLTGSLAAQSRNVAYLEVAGNGILPTANYERQLSERWYGRIGLGLVAATSDVDSDVTFIVPLMVNYLTNPAGVHHLEAGAGLTIVAGDSQDLYWDDEEEEQISNAVGTATLGYRYQKPARGFVFRAGVTPLFDGSEILPWAGVSFGYRW
jgi:hypothetical protein